MTPVEFITQHRARVGAGALLLFIVLYIFLFASPRDFPRGGQITIASGTPLLAIAEELSRERIIKSSAALTFILRVSGASRKVQAGTYVFNSPQNAVTVAYRLATGAYDLSPVRITFPEGVTVRDIAERTEQALPLLSAAEVIEKGKKHEGYLFPDTYFFEPDADVATILAIMRQNFDAKMMPLMGDIGTSGRSLSDIVIVASLVEKEVRTTENRRIVAGILWNRLARGMPLQVDAVFGYIFDRDTYSPSYADLAVDSPYNTYLHKGLPPGPISNPGIDSIKAALYPTTSTYLYYLTDKNGGIYYATTYAEHQANEKKYLN